VVFLFAKKMVSLQKFKKYIMVSTSLNSVQLHLLRVFSYNRDEKSLNELKDVLFNYYCQKVDEEGKRIWEEKNMSNEMMHELLHTHLRTPYK
jgi:hypothetical protein